MIELGSDAAQVVSSLIDSLGDMENDEIDTTLIELSGKLIANRELAEQAAQAASDFQENNFNRQILRNSLLELERKLEG